MGYFLLAFFGFISFLIKIVGGLFSAFCSQITNVTNILIEAHNQKTIERNNRISRGVIEEESQSVSSLINDGCFGNAIFSGNGAENRGILISEVICSAYNANFPSVVIHTGDSVLEERIRTKFGNTSVIINSQNTVFEPFLNRTNVEITQLVQQIAKENGYSLSNKSNRAIEAMAECLRIAGRTPTLRQFMNCPYNKLASTITKFVEKGIISEEFGEKIKSDIKSGQGDFPTLSQLFSELFSQCSSILAPLGYSYSFDVISSIERNKVFLIDVHSSENKMLIDLIISQLRMATKKSGFLVILHDITVSSTHNVLKEFLCINEKNRPLVLSSEDLYAALCSDDPLFYTVIGKSRKNIIMQHMSAYSASQWSKAIGYYKKTEKTDAKTSGKNYGGMVLFPSYTVSKSTDYHEIREEIIPPEQLQKMNPKELLFYDKSHYQLIHTRADEFVPHFD